MTTPVINVDNLPIVLTPGGNTNDVLFSVDTDGYGGVGFQLTGTWVGTIGIQGSNDNANWYPLPALNLNSGLTITTTFGGNTIGWVSAQTRYVRAQVTAYTSGSITGTAWLRTNTVDPQSPFNYVVGQAPSGTAVNPNPVAVAGYDGTAVRTLKTDANGQLYILPLGNVAPGGTDGGNPLKIGGYASSSAPTAVTAGQRANAWFGLNGQLAVYPVDGGGAQAFYSSASAADGVVASSVGLVVGRSPAYVFNGTTWDRARGDVNGLVTQNSLTANRWQYASASGGIVNTATAVTIATAGANRNYLTDLQIDSDALGTATEIAVRDGAGGTVLWRAKLPSGVAQSRIYQFSTPLKSSTANLLEVVTLTATTGGVYVNAQGSTGT